jgi:hypothetical protein
MRLPARRSAALRPGRSAARLLTVVRRLSISIRLVILALAGQAPGRQQAGPVRRFWFQAQRGPPLV